MEVALSGRPFSSSELAYQQRRNLVQSNPSSTGDCFPARKPKSSCLISGRSKDFKNVETFNLRPGYRLSRSAGKIYVAVQTKDPYIKPKPQPKKFNVAEMEALISDLREQVSLLSTFLEEERLRHGGTRKRAALDLSQKEKDLTASFGEEINKINQAQEEEKLELKSTHDFHVKVINTEHDELVEKMRTEYRMLQASFKIYRSTLQEEMQDELKLKRTEFEWEMKRAIENAIEDNKREMEETFSLERDDLRKEFRVNITNMMKQHATEIEEVKVKYVKKADNIEEMRQRSIKLDTVEEQLKEANKHLKEEKASSRRAKNQLTDVNMKLNILQAQFGEKVSFVEDQHRAVIDALKLDGADVKRRLVRSCEELQLERMARESSEKLRKEAAIRALKARYCDCERRFDNSATSPGDDSETQNNLSSRDHKHGTSHRHNSPMKNYSHSHSESDEMVLFDGVLISKNALVTKGMHLENMITPHHASPHYTAPNETSSHHPSHYHDNCTHVSPYHTFHQQESSHHISPIQESSHHISPLQESSHHISPHHASSHHLSPHHTSPHHTSPHHTSPHDTSPHHATPLHHATPHHATHLTTAILDGDHNGDTIEETDGEHFQDGMHQSMGESSAKLPLNLQRTNESPVNVQRTNESPVNVQRTNESPVNVQRTNESPVNVQRTNESPVNVQRTNNIFSQDTARSLEDADHQNKESKMQPSKDGRSSFSQPQSGQRDGPRDQTSYQRETLSQGGIAELARDSTVQPAEGVLFSESPVGITVQIDTPDSGFSQTGTESTPGSQAGLSHGEFLRKKSAFGSEDPSKRRSHKKSRFVQPKLLTEDDENDGSPFTISSYGTKRRSTRQPSARDLTPPSQKRSPSLYGGHLFPGNNQSKRVTVMVPEGHFSIASSVQLHSPRTSFKNAEKKETPASAKQDEDSDSERTDSPDVIY